MMLTVTHGCFEGSPELFNSLCAALATVSGYYTPVSYTDAQALGYWDEAPEDPLVILLIHDEHCGMINARHCAVLADRLDELEGRLHGRPQMLLLSQQFARGLRYAAAQHTDVKFN